MTPLQRLLEARRQKAYLTTDLQAALDDDQQDDEQIDFDGLLSKRVQDVLRTWED